MIAPGMPQAAPTSSRHETITVCPVCGGAETKAHLEKPAHGEVWHIRRCAACGHGFVANPPSLERLGQIQAHLEADTAGAGEKLSAPRADAENVAFARRIASLTTARGQ